MKGCNSNVCLEEYNDFKQKSAYYQCNEVIDDAVTFDKKFAEWKNKSADFVFRGVREAKYKMYTSAQRKWIQEELSKYFDNYPEYISCLIENYNSLLVLEYFTKQGIKVNDFLTLSLLQHYGNPSPLLDFSHKPEIALYFASKENKNERQKEIDNYVSLYMVKYKNHNDEIFIPTIKAIEENDFCRFEKILKHDMDNNLLPSNVDTSHIRKSFEYPCYDSYKDSPPMFIIGGERGCVNIKSAALNFTASYNFTNPRIKCQDASFILNNDECRPLAEEIVCRYNDDKFEKIYCFNINKDLIPYIKNKYLIKFNDKSIYPDDNESMKIKEALDEIGKKYCPQAFIENIRAKSGIITCLPECSSSKNIVADRIKQKYLQLYFDLCKEEYHLWENGKINTKVWESWLNGMRTTMKNKRYVAAWRILSEPYEQNFWCFFQKKVIDWKKNVTKSDDTNTKEEEW